jgi:hypothetical protein
MHTTALSTAAAAMNRQFSAYVDRYDERKYPPAVLERLRTVFARPDWFQPEDIELALRWKYGHLSKENYPGAQRRLARRIASHWPDHRIDPGEAPVDALARWRELVGPTSYITICFLIHLVAPNDWPILDQHNFRAILHHLRQASVAVSDKAAPSTAEDLVLARDFCRGVLRVWKPATGRPTPSVGELDRYLMMFGKALKAESRRH